MLVNRGLDRASSLGEAIVRRRLRRAFTEFADPAKQRCFKLGHSEQHPLVDKCSFGRSQRWDQSGGRVQIGEVKADRRRLEHGGAVAELKRRNPP